MSKYTEKEVNTNETKLHKKKRKHSIPSRKGNDDIDEYEWVEKVENPSCSSRTENKVAKTQETVSDENEWMNIFDEYFLSCSSNANKRKLNSERVSEVKKLDEPGQSSKELNPYWRDGGNGLPCKDREKSDNVHVMDVTWLKKSLKRAEEQALRDNKSLDEVASERWGSLENIRSMIARTEKLSNLKEDKSNYKRYANDKYNVDSHRRFDSRLKDYSKSPSGSKSRTRESETSRMPNYQAPYKEQKRVFQKPKDTNNFVNQTTTWQSSSNYSKNWKKPCEKKCEATLSRSEVEKSNIEINENQTNQEGKSKEGNTILTEAEMNKLGAKIIKAELMGDTKIAAELKIQLEQARKVVANNTDIEKKPKVLPNLDTKDNTRPIQLGNKSKQYSKSCGKKVLPETHVSGDFANNDKYSLQKMFQREEKVLTSQRELFLTATVSKNMDDINDVGQEIASKKAEQVKRDCTYPITTYKDSIKYIDNCWWCLDSKNMLKHMIITMDEMVCLSLPVYTSLTTNHCILTSTQHVACQLQLDEDVWERLKELKTRLKKMFTAENYYPIFFEVYKKHQKYSHMQVQCIPLPKEIGELAPIYFKKALLECETEWSVNKKIVDLKHDNIRHAIPNGLSYFVIEFASHSGYAHVIESEEMFPKNFAEEIIGGMLDLNCNLWRKPKRQSFEEQILKISEFTQMWKKYNSLEN